MIRDQVRVCSFGLDVPPVVVERLDALLPLEERDASVHRRVARATTRLLVAEAVGIDPAAIEITRRCEHCGHPSHGRPQLVGLDSIGFSLSHSGEFALVAIAPAGVRVGVDVEMMRPRARLGALAVRVLNDDEYRAWRRVGKEARLRAFLRAWTAKEAYLKALGVGIAARLRDVRAPEDGWYTTDIDNGDATVAALAVDRADVVLTRVPVPEAAGPHAGTGG